MTSTSRNSRARIALAIAAGWALSCSNVGTRPARPQNHEARRGHLLIVGGGPIPDALLERFVVLAGGRGRARILVLPMASEDPEAGKEITENFQKLGADAERLVWSRAQADSGDAVRTLEGATGIWFGGGDQSRLTAALLHTKAEEAIRRRYHEGAVVGGTSAGAAVMSTPMLTGDERHPGGGRPPERDSSDAYMTIARDNVVTTEGLALLPGAIVDQHFIRRRRNNRLLSLVLEHPALLGAGIDESTALEVGPDGLWRVLGESAVVVFDARKARITPPGDAPAGAAGVLLHVLPAGSTFDPAAGQPALP